MIPSENACAGKTSVCEQALSLFGCSPGVINPMWDQPVRVVARLRVSAQVADSLLNDGEPLHLRRIFAAALNIDVSRIEVGGNSLRRSFVALCDSYCMPMAF